MYISSHLPHSLPFHTHTVIFSKGTVYIFVSGEENTAGRVFTAAFARFDSRRARSKRRFCASLLFFLFPSAAKVFFFAATPRRRGERRAILASDAKANLSEGRDKVIEAFF